MKPSPIRRAWPVLLAVAAAAALWDPLAPPDDIGAEQLDDAINHAQRDAEERRIAAAFKEGTK